ncbi:MAG: GAF domain-containing protein [Filifactoraceae bacterium]
MIKIEKQQFESKEKLYNYIKLKLLGMVSAEHQWLASLANSSALLWELLDDINWVGYYLYKDGELVLGPFQGKVACTRISLDKGVCGAAASTRTVQLVEDVHKFSGHIACDSASNSEIVLPIVINDKLIGVLDIDSPKFKRFDKEDQKGLEKFLEIMIKYVEFPDKFI